MKNTKWTAQELLDSFNRECNQDEMNELYKALVAYSVGATEIDDTLLDKTIEYYFDNDNITSIINEDILDFYEKSIDN
jgi:hypothetical protein